MIYNYEDIFSSEHRLCNHEGLFESANRIAKRGSDAAKNAANSATDWTKGSVESAARLASEAREKVKEGVRRGLDALKEKGLDELFNEMTDELLGRVEAALEKGGETVQNFKEKATALVEQLRCLKEEDLLDYLKRIAGRNMLAKFRRILLALYPELTETFELANLAKRVERGDDNALRQIQAKMRPKLTWTEWLSDLSISGLPFLIINKLWRKEIARRYKEGLAEASRKTGFSVAVIEFIVLDS